MVNKSASVSLRLCFLPQLSLWSHTVATELGSLLRPFVKVPILCVEGTGPSVLGRFNSTRPHNGGAVLLNQHLFHLFISLLSPVPPDFFFFWHFNYIPPGPSAPGRPYRGASPSLWLCISCHRSAVLLCLFAVLQASLSIFICAPLNLCVHEMQIRYLIPSSMYTASSTFCAYILTALCELQAVVYSRACFWAGILPAWAVATNPFILMKLNWCLNVFDQWWRILIFSGTVLLPFCYHLQLWPFQAFV